MGGISPLNEFRASDSLDTKSLNVENRIDITKRLDVALIGYEKKNSEVDITKRIEYIGDHKEASESKSKDVKELTKDYIADLKDKSEFPDSIDVSKLDVSNLKPVSHELNVDMRIDFANKKSDLRKEWEVLNKTEWPRYKEPVYNEFGVKVRDVGDRYDAHHIQPLSLGGKNEASNITPLSIDKHKEVHSKDGSCTKLVRSLEGEEK